MSAAMGQSATDDPPKETEVPVIRSNSRLAHQYLGVQQRALIAACFPTKPQAQPISEHEVVHT